MSDSYPNTVKRFMTLYLKLEHLKYCLNTSKFDTRYYPLKVSILFLLKSYLFNYLQIIFFLYKHNSSVNAPCSDSHVLSTPFHPPLE